MEDNSLTHSVIIALGSNCRHDANLDRATTLLGRFVSGMKTSRRLLTEPVGIASGPFMNQIVTGTCEMDMDALTDATKQIEAACGRTAVSMTKGIVEIDIDILQYDSTRHHLGDWDRDYIKTLIKELL